MTRKEAKQAISDYYCHTELLDEYGDYCDQTEYEKAFDMAIKALEQEPKAEVLDKIRAEIMDLEEELFHRPNTDYSDYSAVRYCVEIIDKYKSESEEKE